MSLDLAGILERNIGLSDALLSEVARRMGDQEAREKLSIPQLQALTGIFSKVQRTQNTAVNARRALAKDAQAFVAKLSDAEKRQVLVLFYQSLSREQRIDLLEELRTATE